MFFIIFPSFPSARADEQEARRREEGKRSAQGLHWSDGGRPA